jgi:hypothetical protein
MWRSTQLDFRILLSQPRMQAYLKSGVGKRRELNLISEAK